MKEYPSYLIEKWEKEKRHSIATAQLEDMFGISTQAAVLAEVREGETIVSEERIRKLESAVRGALGYFALFNEEKDRKKWPAYVRRCEEALK